METQRETQNLGKNIFSLGNILKLFSLRMVLTKALQAVKQGFTNLLQYSGTVNKSLSSISASIDAFKNSLATAFAPILNAIAPVITQIIDYCTAAANAIARLFSLIGGKATYTKAIKANKDLAASYAGVGSAAEKAKGQAAKFDEFNIVGQDNNAGGGGGAGVGSMFTEEAVGQETELSKRLKAIWEDILGIIGAIKKAWQEAWEFNGNGEAIMAVLRQMLFDVLDTIKVITGATREWAESLNLIPLVTAIRNVLESLEPVLDTILGVVEYIWIHAVLPIAKWVAESALPAFLDVVAGALDVINAVLTVIVDALTLMWESFIEPIAGPLGDLIVGILETVAGWLEDLAKWIDKNHDLLEAIVIVVTTVIGTLTAFNTVVGIVSAVLTALSTGPIVLVIGAIGALIAILIQAAGGWENFKTIVLNVINAIVNRFDSAGWHVRDIFNNLKTILNGLITFITGVFTGNWKKAWEGVKTVFKGIFDMLGNIVKAALNSVIRTINSLSFTAPDWVPYFGGKRFGFSIPYLASGAYVPPNAGEFMAVLGDNKTEGEFVAPESKLQAAVANAMREVGGTSNEDILNALNTLIAVVKAKPTGITKKQIGSAAVDYINEETIRTNNSPVMV